MAKEKQYVRAGARAVDTQYGQLLNLNLNIEDLKEIANDQGWIKLTIGERREVSESGNTHSVWVNDYEPKKKDESEDMDI